MTIDEILAVPDFKKAVDVLTKDTREDREREEYRKEYKGERTRRAASVDKRENKSVDVYSETETEFDNDGNEVPKRLAQSQYSSQRQRQTSRSVLSELQRRSSSGVR